MSGYRLSTITNSNMILSIVYPNSDVPRNEMDIKYQNGDGNAVKTTL